MGGGVKHGALKPQSLPHVRLVIYEKQGEGEKRRGRGKNDGNCEPSNAIPSLSCTTMAMELHTGFGERHNLERATSLSAQT